jgi:hypothetical protein
MPGSPMFVQGGGIGTGGFVLALNAMQLVHNSLPNATTSSGPHSSDLIPPLRGLS